jgi:PAS domain S-box-containing protein
MKNKQDRDRGKATKRSPGRGAATKNISELKNEEEALKTALQRSRQHEAELIALEKGIRSLLEYTDFNDAAQAIFDSCKQLLGAKAGYVALLSEDETQNELVFLDAGGLPCTVDPSLPMPVRGLRAEAYRTGEVVYENNFAASKWTELMPEGHALLENVLFAPLVNEGKVIGLIGLANKPGGFTENDAKLAQVFAEQAVLGFNKNRALRDLRASEKRYRSFIEVTGELGWVTNADGEVVEDIPSFRNFTGQTYEEVKGWGWTKALHPDDLERTTQIWRQAIGEKSDYETEYRLRRSDGVYRYFLARGVPVFTEGGRIREWVGTCLDITERVRAEATLLQSQEDLNRAQAVAQTGSWRLDVQRDELLWSDETHRIFGVPKETPMTYEGFLSRVHPEDREYVNSKWQAALQGEDYDIEHRIIVENDVKWVREKAELEFDEQGMIRGGFGTVQEITERKKIDTMKDEFIGMVSHEIKTPITVIMGSIHVAMTEGVTREEVRDMMTSAASSAESLASIVDNLLELSRAQANRLMIRRERVDIAEVARQVMRNMERKSAIHRFIVDFPPALPQVSAERVRVERVLSNLIDNAMKYSPKGGDVTVFAQREDGCLAVGVKDQGVGISSEDQMRLFKPFERLEATNTIGGVGLGLNVCRHLIEAHGGRIWVESEPGKGATFLFTLPYA